MIKGEQNVNKMLKLFIIAVVLMGQSSCSSKYFLPEPVGIGPERDQLKRSPCACYEIPLLFLERSRDVQFS
jgi:hypothetical protein